MQKTYPTLPGGWEIVKKLGAGSSGAVYSAKRSTGGLIEWAAVKHVSIPKDEDELRDIQNNPALHTGFGVKTYIDEMKDTFVEEYSQMLQLRGHANIVTCFDVQIVQKTDSPGYDMFIWMELLTSLPDRINAGKWDRAETIRLGIDICEALIHLESKRLVHRDIKPQNLFVHENGHYKLGDFGTTRAIRGTSSVLSGKGTPAYMAPEIVMNKKASFTADVYSLGLVLYELMNGNRPPFIKPDEPVTHTSLNVAGVFRVSGKPLPAPAFADEGLAKIILKACEYDPRKRWQSAAEMQAALKKLQSGGAEPRKKGKLGVVLLLAALIGMGGYFLSRENDDVPGNLDQVAAVFQQESTQENKPTVSAKSIRAEYSVDTQKLTLSWTGNASTWNIRYGYSGSNYIVKTTSSKSMVFSGLVEGKTYDFYVFPQGDSYNSPTSAALSYTIPTRPRATNVTADYNSTTKQLTLKWSGDASTWNIYYGYSGGYYTTKATSSKSVVLSALEGGRTYTFYVYPAGDNYNGDTSASCSYKIPASTTTTTSSTSRTFTVSTSVKSNKGQITFNWTDSENRSPYTLEYTMVGTNQYTNRVTGITSKSKTVYDAIPGEQYRVVVTDKNGNTAKATVRIPSAAAFSDGKLKQTSVSISIEGRYRPSSSTEYKNAQQVTLIAKNMTNGIRNKGYQFGIRYQINFPQLASTRTFNTMKVFRAPNGFQLAEYNGAITYSDFNNNAGGSYHYWYCCGEEFFRALLDVNGSILAGKYYVDLYWDGMFVRTQSFEVK